MPTSTAHQPAQFGLRKSLELLWPALACRDRKIATRLGAADTAS